MMKLFFKKHRIGVSLLLLIVLQSCIYICFGSKKNYLHMDEAYSLGLTHYKQVEILDNLDFYDTWHDGNYYLEYLIPKSNGGGHSDLRKVYENQKNDVHPPFYYLLLRIAQMFSSNLYWPGIMLNVIISGVESLFLFLLCKRFYQKEKYKTEKALFFTFLSSTSLAVISSVIYIRMYALTSLFVLMTSYYHLRLIEDEDKNKNYIGIFFSSFLGSLTHYYFLFYLFFLFIGTCVNLRKKKDIRNLKFYFLTILLAAISSLLLFPYSIQHMFFGYRGQGAIEKLLNWTDIAQRIGSYFLKLNEYAFALYLIPALVILHIMILKGKKKGMKRSESDKNIFFYASLSYFVLVSIISPYIELRYIMPICSITIPFVLDYFLSFFNEKKKRLILIMFIILVFVNTCFPILKPEVLYEEHAKVVKEIEEHSSIPAVYFLSMDNQRFLDDILLFSKLDSSYITKKLEFQEENLIPIFAKKDLSKGVYIFINQPEKASEALREIKNVLHFTNQEHIFHLNAADIYYLS